MPSELLETVEIETGNNPSHTVIWLHGMGADGYDFEPIVKAMDLPETTSLRFIFPHAPVRSVTINGGMAMRAWYDFRQMIPGQGEDQGHIQESVRAVLDLIDHEVQRGMDTRRICLAGFSQGGVIALLTAVQSDIPLAAVMGLSTYMPLDGEGLSRPAGNPPFFLAHGQYDDVLPLPLGQKARCELEGLGLEVEWHEYPMGHSVCEEEIRHIRDWLLRVLV